MLSLLNVVKAFYFLIFGISILQASRLLSSW